MEDLKNALHDLGVYICAFIMKIGLLFILPFKFVQFWIESYKKQNAKKNK